MGNKNILAMFTELWWSFFYTVVTRERIFKSVFPLGEGKIIEKLGIYSDACLVYGNSCANGD